MAEVEDRRLVEPADLPAFGRPVRLVWRKHRWRCPAGSCPTVSWTGIDLRFAAPRLGLSDRERRWATFQIGKHGRTVSKLARSWMPLATVNDAALAYRELSWTPTGIGSAR